jgi:hypothetical protein
VLVQTQGFARTRPSIWADFVKSIPDAKSATPTPLVAPGGSCEAQAVTLSPRALGVVICLLAPACFGGPTSEWPTSDHEDEGPKSPPSNSGGAGSADAGVLQAAMDAATKPSVSDDAPPCDSTQDGGTESLVDDPDDPGNPYDSDPDGPVAGDAGCR